MRRVNRPFCQELNRHIAEVLPDSFATVEMEDITKNDKLVMQFVYFISHLADYYPAMSREDFRCSFIEATLMEYKTVKDADVYVSTLVPEKNNDAYEDYESLYGTLETMYDDVIEYDIKSKFVKEVVKDLALEEILDNSKGAMFDVCIHSHQLSLYIY